MKGQNKINTILIPKEYMSCVTNIKIFFSTQKKSKKWTH